MERKTGAVMLRLLFPLCAALLVLVRAGGAAAQAEGQELSSEVSIYSDVIDEASLPLPGYPLTLTAQLVNTTDVSDVMRAFVSLDGRVMSVLPAKAYLNKYDSPEYVFQIHAPVSELSYQFVLYRKDEPALFSERFTVQRSCLPDVEPVQGSLDPELQGDELLGAMVRRSTALDREAALYTESGLMLTQIKKLLAELEK